MNNLEIINICQTLKIEGKEPSIALIKSRISKSTPMPVLISGLQQWRANPNVKIASAEKETGVSLEKKTLEQRVDTLEKEITYLKSLISK